MSVNLSSVAQEQFDTEVKHAYQGMKTLREDGWSKVKKGITTVAEVLRVTQQE